jgi:hypothetical protein
VRVERELEGENTMNIVSKKTIAAVLASGPAFFGGASMAQEQSINGASTSQDGANVIVPHAGATGHECLRGYVENEE